MYHLIMFWILATIYVVSLKVDFISQNVQISLVIVSIVAIIRFLIERDLAYGDRLLEHAIALENTNKDSANSATGKCVHFYPEERQVLSGFYDFLFVFEGGEEKILSTSKKDVMNKLLNNKGPLLVYFKEGIIVDVEVITETEGISK